MQVMSHNKMNGVGQYNLLQCVTRKHVGVCVCLYTVGVSVEKRDVRERVFTFCPQLLPYGTDLFQYNETGI